MKLLNNDKFVIILKNYYNNIKNIYPNKKLKAVY